MIEKRIQKIQIKDKGKIQENRLRTFRYFYCISESRLALTIISSVSFKPTNLHKGWHVILCIYWTFKTRLLMSGLGPHCLETSVLDPY